MISNLRPTEIIIIILVVVVIFGAAKLPTIASNVGKSMKVFKKEMTELRDDDKPGEHTQVHGSAPAQMQQAPQSYPQQPGTYPQGPVSQQPAPPQGAPQYPQGTYPQQGAAQPQDPNAPGTR